MKTTKTLTLIATAALAAAFTAHAADPQWERGGRGARNGNVGNVPPAARVAAPLPPAAAQPAFWRAQAPAAVAAQHPVFTPPAVYERQQRPAFNRPEFAERRSEIGRAHV